MTYYRSFDHGHLEKHALIPISIFIQYGVILQSGGNPS